MSIPIIYSPKHREHNPPYELYDGVRESYAEVPDRIESIVESLKSIRFGNFKNPLSFPLHHILAVHDLEYVRFIKNRSKGLKKSELLFPSYFINDTYAPLTRGTFSAAKSSADTALTGADRLLRGDQIVYALTRPPGHHAEPSRMGGYCYFNNAAIAAQYLSGKGKVAILDIDFHHGNGTQSIFYDRSDVLYVSLHADPRQKFPYYSGFANETGRGGGIGYTKNYSLRLGTGNRVYRSVLLNAIEEIRKYNPKYLIVSAGFDTYEHDPIGGFRLTMPFYETIGKDISSLNLPTLIIQEGGYHVKDLGEMAVRFLKGISHKILT